MSENKPEDISIDFGKAAEKTHAWLKKNYVLFLILIPILLSIFIRIQTAYLPMIDDVAEANIRSYIQASIQEQVNAQYPNLPDANKQVLVQQELERIYAAGTIDYLGQQVPLEDLVKENAKQIKEQFQDEYGLTYLSEIDPWYFYRLTENYLEHGYEGDIELNGKYYDDHQLAGTPREYLGGEISTLPHFHVMVEVYLYKLVHLFLPNMRLMTLVYFLPVLLAALSVIPAFFLVRKVAGNMGAVVAATLVAVHPSFVSRTIAGFSDTDGYNVLFPLCIMWVFIEAIEAESWKKATLLAALAGVLMGIFSFTWGGWWYIYDFLLGVCFISLWYVFLREEIKEKDKQARVKYIFGALLFAPLFVLWKLVLFVSQSIAAKEKEETNEIKNTVLAIMIFLFSCAVFVSLFSSFSAFIGAVKEPLTFSTIKEVGVIKIWPNVLTTVAEFNPASLPEIIGNASFGIAILLLLGFLGIGYALFERQVIEKEQEVIVAGSLFWVVALTLLSNKFTGDIIYTMLLLVPVAYCFYKKTPLTTIYFVGISVWYAAIGRYIPDLASHLFMFFFLLGIPLFIGVVYALVEHHKADMKYAVLLFIWFVGTIYASTQGIRFIMILVPAFSVAAGLGTAFIYRLWADVCAEKLNIKKIYVKSVLVIAVAILLFIPVGVGYSLGSQQMPLINDQWYNALKKIDEQAAPDAIVNSWWDFGHWFKAIADRAVTFDGGSQDTPQAHWIGNVLLTSNEKEAVAILRMLDCGGNSAYDLIYNATNHSYKSITLTKQIILETEEEAAETLNAAGLTEEQTKKILTFTHCQPPENYFITSQDMVGKTPVWAHFGSWDFDRAHIVNLVNSYEKETALIMMQEDLAITEEQAMEFYAQATTNDPNNWIAAWPSYVSMPGGCGQVGEELHCGAGMLINLTNGDTRIMTSDGLKHPLKLLYVNPEGEYNITDFGVYSDVLVGADGRSYSAALIPEGTGFKGFFMDTALMDSMFTKLFFYKGHGLECFDLFDEQDTVTGDKIYVWKVDWACSSANEVFVTASLPVVSETV
jgi:dolichyl-diphosphooligosaccharide--protein glycosyltransferase